MEIFRDDIVGQLTISAGMIASTTFVHGVFVAIAAAIFRSASHQFFNRIRMLRDSVALVLVMLILAIGHAVEIWMWAVAFLQLDLFIELESALYFAAVSYTTLGFGDVLIDPPWRLLSGAAAANGLLLFGMSAALLLEVAKGLRLSGSR